MNVTNDLLLYPEDIERLEFTGVRLADGTLKAFNNSTPFKDWPQFVTLCNRNGTSGSQKFVLREQDDDETYLKEVEGETNPEGATGSMAWYEPVPDSPEKA